MRKNQLTATQIETAKVDGRVYDNNFRYAVCKVAASLNNYSEAARLFNLANSTVWRWMKTFGYANDYFADRHLSDVKATPFDDIKKIGYPDDIRLAAAIDAVHHGIPASAFFHGVSEGSVYNWVKSFGLARQYKNTYRRKV